MRSEIKVELAGGEGEPSLGVDRVRHRRRWVAAAVLAVVAGLAIWYWATRPGDVAVVGAPAGTGSDWAGAAAPGVVRTRVADVLAGIPGASAPERTEGPVTWTSHFTLAGGEAGVLTMRSDPADLNYASITLPLGTGDEASAERTAATARRFLRNVAPDYDGIGLWLGSAIKTAGEHPEQTPTTRNDRATFTVRAIHSGREPNFCVEMRVNR